MLTIVVLNFHFRGPKKYRVPKWARYWIIGNLGYCLCMTYGKKMTVKNKTTKSCQKSSVKDMMSGMKHSYRDNNIKDGYFVIHRNIATSPVEENSIHQNQNEDQINETNTPAKITEDTIKKIINSFEMDKLKNNELKLKILKEILCAQINLIDSNEKRAKTKENMQLIEIYDEWKLLAQVIDCLCFYMYLITLISSSLLFYLYIYFNT